VTVFIRDVKASRLVWPRGQIIWYRPRSNWPRAKLASLTSLVFMTLNYIKQTSN